MNMCIFCQIADGHVTSERIIYEDDYTVAFFPDEPIAAGHSLIIPREHIADIWGLDQETSSQIMNTALKVAAAIRKGLNPHGLNLVQNNGNVGGQNVFHIHFHLIPRWSNDTIGDLTPATPKISETKLTEAFRAIKTILNR